MATLILSTVGGLFGGKIGRAVGAIAGNLIDRKLFAPKGRQGPRLGDLAFQSSQYGALIPKLYGTNRVSGTVIWATDLREDRKKVSNGKGQPKTTTFSYSASFAVALSARRILRIGRIWADGNLLRGSAGDFKVATGFRLHDGGAAQGVDPLIASAEGRGRAPAYRGLAYVVFENLQLGDFGNRIPSLSFEVIADEGDVSVGAIINDLAGRAVGADCPTRIGGYAAYGDAVRGAVETLGSAIAFSAYDDGMRLRVTETGAQAAAITEADLGAVRGEERSARLPIERRSASTIPETLSITYYEPSRDYQQGVQRARRDGGARREAKIELPVVLAPEIAKQIAERQLDRIWAARASAKIRLPWRRIDLVPGQRVAVAGSPALWRVDAVTLDRMVIEADLVRLSEGGAVIPNADPGRGLIQNDAPHGATAFHLIDLPPIEAGVASMPHLVVAAAGVSSGWRRAALLLSIDGGASWEEAGVTAAPAIIGAADAVLGVGSACLIDEANSVEVTLLNAAMTLGNADAAGLDAGRNLAMLGDELIQFRTALPLGNNRYRLSGLYRGRRGTQWAIAGHGAGERFVLIERDALAAITVPPSLAQVMVMAVGIGDGAMPPTRTVLHPGQALRPIAPVHLCAERMGDGRIGLNWVRRSRDGWRWIDSVDAPLAEEQERYRLTVTPDVGAAEQVETMVGAHLYSPPAGATSLTVSVVQIGIFGPSRAAVIMINLTSGA
ncbi:MAG: phage tail protein [Pseudomonadota bacterium]